MLRAEYLYWLVGAFLLATALFNLHARRWPQVGFWMLLALPFLFGEAILAAEKDGLRWPVQAMGIVVLILALLATRIRLGSHVDSPAEIERRSESARNLGNRLFTPALGIPVLTMVLFLVGTWLQSGGWSLFEDKAITLSSLGVASVVTLFLAMRTTQASFVVGVREGGRLLDSISWAVLLPMLLATLGAVFAATGVGDAIAALTTQAIPVDNRMVVLLAFAFGMVLFTVIMGNAFAAFPVMMSGIGLPLLIGQHHATPAILGALGMLTGYCGTLLTPMAANFNIVPAVLLELRSQYAVIRSQIPTAFALLVVNIVLMAVLVFP
ncbi:MAG: DUF979 domain-containing protein [Dokdonella sp.]